MKVRTLGLRVQELETGPYIFLLVDSIPIAYRDRSPDAEAPGAYRTDRRFNKAATRAQNRWLGNRRYDIISHEKIEAVFASVSRFSEPDVPERRANPIGRRETDRDPVQAFLSHAMEILPEKKPA
jgi:hypothetical protein